MTEQPAQDEHMAYHQVFLAQEVRLHGRPRFQHLLQVVEQLFIADKSSQGLWLAIPSGASSTARGRMWKSRKMELSTRDGAIHAGGHEDFLHARRDRRVAVLHHDVGHAPSLIVERDRKVMFGPRASRAPFSACVAGVAATLLPAR